MRELANYIFGKVSPNLSQKPEHIRFTLVLLFVCALPFDLFYSNIILFLMAGTTVFDLSKDKFKNIPKQFWLFQALYFLTLLGYFYSYNKSAAGFLLERQLTILLIPLLLPLAITITEQRVQLVLKAFVVSTSLAILILFANVLVSLRELHLPLVRLFSKEFFNHQFSAPLGIHAGYLSLYVATSSFYLMQELFKNRQKLLWPLLLLALHFAGLFFLASRNAFISTFIIVVVLLPFFYIKRKARYFIAITLAFVACGLIITQVPYINQRFTSELLNDIHAKHTVDSPESAEPRVERWKCGLELLKQSPVTGFGTGDEIDLLKVEYMKHGLYISYMEDFNAHNQYLSYSLKNGLIGLLLFLALFAYYLRLAIQHKSFMYLAFLLLLLIGFFTENILDANKGILFFAFFNTLFGYNALRHKNAEEIN